eukprot:3264366-Pyramimonas_sp.AAC.1
MSACQGVVVLAASTVAASAPGRALPSNVGPWFLGFGLSSALASCARTLAPASTACRSPDRMAVCRKPFAPRCSTIRSWSSGAM